MLYRLDDIEQKLDNLETNYYDLKYNLKNAGIYLNTLAQLLIDHDVCTPEDIIEMLAEKTETRPDN